VDNAITEAIIEAITEATNGAITGVITGVITGAIAGVREKDRVTIVTIGIGEITDLTEIVRKNPTKEGKWISMILKV